MVVPGRLEWVQHNRTGKKRAQRAATVVARVAERLDQRAHSACEEMAAALAGLVDGEFRAHCRVAGLRSGTLVIAVDHPARVASMRLRWSPQIKKALNEGHRRVAKVVFETARVGVCVRDQHSTSTQPGPGMLQIPSQQACEGAEHGSNR